MSKFIYLTSGKTGIIIKRKISVQKFFTEFSEFSKESRSRGKGRGLQPRENSIPSGAIF